MPNRSGQVDVLLTHSYHLAHDAKQWRKMQPYPPLGTLYAASALRSAGISVAVFDSMFADPIGGFQEALELHQPRLVAIYEDDFNFVTKMCLTHMRELASSLAMIAKKWGVPVIAHGSDATDHPAYYLDRGVTYVLNGEAERTLTELCASLLTSGHAKPLPGLVQYGVDDTLHASATNLKNPEWATLPHAARDLIDLEPYRAAWLSRHSLFSTNIVSSRGCPYRCNWCAKPISGDSFHLRAPEQVAAEMRELKTAHNVQHLWFSDDVFALDRHWIERFAVAVESFDARVPFKIQSRADLMIPSTIAALQRAGCDEVWMGVESGSQKILNAMNKGLKLSSVHTARHRLADAGIRACYFLQLGYPGEAWPEINETIDLVRTSRPDDIGVSISYPLPGTPFYERVQEQLGAKRNWSDSDDLCSIHWAAYNDIFYHALRDALHAEVDAPDLDHTAALWDRVHDLEASSRNRNVVELEHMHEIFPLANLVAAIRRA